MEPVGNLNFKCMRFPPYSAFAMNHHNQSRNQKGLVGNLKINFSYNHCITSSKWRKSNGSF